MRGSYCMFVHVCLHVRAFKDLKSGMYAVLSNIEPTLPLKCVPERCYLGWLLTVCPALCTPDDELFTQSSQPCMPHACNHIIHTHTHSHASKSVYIHTGLRQRFVFLAVC